MAKLSMLPDYTIPDVMRELAVSRDTIQTLVKNGELQAYKVGSRFRFERREIEDFKTRNAVRVKTGSVPRPSKRTGASSTVKQYIYKPGDKVV